MAVTTVLSDRNFLTPNEAIALEVTGLIVLLANISLSSLSMLIIRATRQIETTSSRIVFYINLSDLGTAVYRLFVLLLTFDRKKVTFHVEFEIGVQFIACQVSYFSAYVIVILALDRYLHVKYLKDVTLKFTNRKVDVLIALAFLVSIAFAAMLTVETVYKQYFNLKYARYALNTGLFFSAIVFYILTMLNMREHERHATNKQFINKLNKTVTVISSAYLFSIVLFYAPILILLTLKATMEKAKWRREHMELFFHIAILFAQFNTVFNATMYMVVNRKARKMILVLFHKYKWNVVEKE